MTDDVTAEAPTTSTPPIPVMARRTYTALRLGSVAVIAVLTTAILLSIDPAGDCLQRSISAYYYTGVQSVFVGTLITLGFVMIVLWGKTPFEDGMLNIAGMLAPVVAFVPTGDADNCGVIDAFGNRVKKVDTPEAIDARHQAILNNVQAYLIVLSVSVVVIFIFGTIAQSRGKKWLTEHPVAYWGPWLMAVAITVTGWVLMAEDGHDKLFNGAHELSATFMFIFIGMAVLTVANQKRTGTHEIPQQPQPGRAITYALIAALMLAGAIVLVFVPGSEFFESHRTLWLEAWEILWLAVFWGLQTWDRRNEGAPPRTPDEAVRMGRPA
jgi:hypothetical protein